MRPFQQSINASAGRGLLLALLIAALGSNALAAAPQSQAKPAGPTISFGARSVSITGFSPRSRVAFVGVAFVPTEQATTLRRWAKVLDTDSDGAVTFDLGIDLPQQSMWAAVDVNGGQYASAGGPVSGATIVDETRGRFRKGSNGVDRFGFNGASLDLLYVHPGHGVWVWRDRDGSRTDTDGPSGLTMVDITAGLPLGGNYDKPKEFVPGGILVAIDWLRMRILTTRLTGAMLGGAQ